jgi:hypothetical protein
MYLLKKSIIFDIEQRYFLLNKIDVIICETIVTWVFHALFYFNKQNLMAF